MDKALDDEAAAACLFEERRWRFGIVCPHCGAAARMGKLQRAEGASELYKCYHCRTFSTSRTGTLLAGSHLTCHTWFAAAVLLVATDGDVGVSAFVRLFGISNQTATRLRKQIMAQLAALGAGEASAEPRRAARVAEARALVARSLSDPDPEEAQRMSPNARRRARLLRILRDVSDPQVERLFLVLLDAMIFPQRLDKQKPSGSSWRGKNPPPARTVDAAKPRSLRK